jgi:dienelactone hydrolase
LTPAAQGNKGEASKNSYAEPKESPMTLFYPNVGYAFNRKGWDGYRPEADAASWPRTLDFFRRHLLDVAPRKAAAAR